MGKRNAGEIAFRCSIHAKRAWPLRELAGKRLVGSHPEAKCSLGAVASVSFYPLHHALLPKELFVAG